MALAAYVSKDSAKAKFIRFSAKAAFNFNRNLQLKLGAIEKRPPFQVASYFLDLFAAGCLRRSMLES